MKPWALCLCLLSSSFAWCQHFKVLHSFSGYPKDGAHSISDVVFDENGNLYGTTAGGGSGTGCGGNGCGTVFELSPNTDGTWTEVVLHSFCSDFGGGACLDGAYPYAGLVVDADGNLYGTAMSGGTGCVYSCGAGGVVFELSPPANSGGAWTETVLYNFCSIVQGLQCYDGEEPTDQLTFDSAGNLYGTTFGGGSGHLIQGGGTVFELSPSADGWKETVLYNFCSLGGGDNCPDGSNVWSGVTFDGEGNLYGTTMYSGIAPAGGTVYELSPSGNGWKYRELLDIPANSKPSVLRGAVSFDASGNLYSTFSAPNGGVFQMALPTRSLRIFSLDGTDGSQPGGGIYMDSATKMAYGTAGAGGASDVGTIFKITQSGKETVLHDFCSLSACDDGEIPDSTPVPDVGGNLYGTTEFGGIDGLGVVWEISP